MEVSVQKPTVLKLALLKNTISAAAAKNFFFIRRSHLKMKGSIKPSLAAAKYWENIPAPRQGDQIGQIYAHCVTVYFGQLLENYRST
jgi:hypothetical protein